MGEALKVGLIGAGFVGEIHARSYQRLLDLGVRVKAVAAVPQNQADALAQKMGIEFATDDYRRILDSKDIDVVDLCVPNNLHKKIAIEAAEAGKHIICEKPLTGYFGEDTDEEWVGRVPKRHMLEVAINNADEMLAAAHRYGVKLAYAENWLYAPVVQKARNLVLASGGTILEMRAIEAHSGSHATYAKIWKYAGGGALVRLGPHPIGVTMYLKAQEGLARDGKPIRVKSVTAEVGNLVETESMRREEKKWLVADWEDVENWASVIMTFTDGTRAVLSASDVVLGGMEDSLQIHMSNARINCNMTRSNMCEAYAPDPSIFASEYIAEKLETKGGWSFPSIDEEWMLGYPQEIRDFVESVLFDREPVANGQFGRDVVEILYSAYVSAEEGVRVELPAR
ncbi:MAG: Gfo/Idh/MocA family protein [Chloroflexota bacterium]